MRVLHIVDNLEVGGAEMSLLDILRNLPTAEAHICHLFPAATLATEFESAGIEVHSLGVSNRHAALTLVLRLRKLIKSVRPDLVQITGFYSSFVGRIAAGLSRVPIVESFNSPGYTREHYDRTPRRSRWKLRLAQSLDRWSLSWVAHSIAVSYSARDLNVETLGVPRIRTTVIYRGRDPKVFGSATQVEIGILRRELGLAETDQLVLNVAALRPPKGQDLLVRSMAAVSRQFPRSRLLIAGEGLFRPNLEELICTLDLGSKVQLLGLRQDVPLLLQAADVFVFPSYREGHPGALVEAMLAGCPIVAADTAVHRETLDHGRTGILTPTGDSGLLTEAVSHLLADSGEAQRLGRNARLDAIGRFDIREVSRLHEEVYSRVLEARDR